ncbi:FKBP-type peptidyl-prolyl cis-trans isomerase [Marinobacterium rhizophilum]|uniref:Peptidyl-prolyl cis-trans isomerase n=1 Tax=Marinobacterium rhizophilum TaxID=420402 RepID=A0ABY5HLY0_9GAMM|nr:FKBP-type peptidyl-prolyl cis-trans isomerase [Marinobacterium rhizophilum]UTW13410.1 FKBP-type peptidyl-prolyl cis-trans isomerase [Marinobacterium rhizophilum]
MGKPGTLPRPLRKHIELLDEQLGQGPAASTGDVVVFNLRLYLHRGDEVRLGVQLNCAQLSNLRALGLMRSTDDGPMLDHQVHLGRRQCIAGIEQSLIGMQAGGYRQVRIAPHLAYGERGMGKQGSPGHIPANALLHAQIWLRRIVSR